MNSTCLISLPLWYIIWVKNGGGAYRKLGVTSLCRRKEPDGLVTATITKQGRVLGTPPILDIGEIQNICGHSSKFCGPGS